MTVISDVSNEDYLTEDATNIPFGVLLKMVKSQMFFPLALLAVIVIKIVSKLKGRTDAINAICRKSEPVEFGDMPFRARTAFVGVANQLEGFRWVRFMQRP